MTALLALSSRANDAWGLAILAAAAVVWWVVEKVIPAREKMRRATHDEIDARRAFEDAMRGEPTNRKHPRGKV